MAGTFFLGPQRVIGGAASGARQQPTTDQLLLASLEALKMIQLQTLLSLRRLERALPGPSDASRRVVVPADSTKVVTILQPNTLRKGGALYNASTAILYMALGYGASTTTPTQAMAAGSYYEVPFWYRGVITGIWAATNGNVIATELT